MSFRKLFPVLTVALSIGLAACAQEGEEEAETELTPADTEAMAPPPAPMETMPADTMMGDTMMGDTAHQM